MHDVNISKILAILGIVFYVIVLGCAGETGQNTGEPRTIAEAKYEIIFEGDTQSDVAFQHKVHSDRFESDCFECHSCGDIIGEILWNCRDCHTPQNPEELCEDDGVHGCIMAQCQYCHEDLEKNPGLSCNDCHS